MTRKEADSLILKIKSFVKTEVCGSIDHMAVVAHNLGLHKAIVVIQEAIEEKNEEKEEGYKDAWIPVKWHEITEEEREENQYLNEWDYLLDCPMPNGGDEILITTRNGAIEKDAVDYDDGYTLDSGLDWREDVVAWMPLPKPYKEGK